jgi:triosephosphate isomerase
MEKKFFIIANWKMNPQTLKDAERLFGAVEKNTKNSENVKVVICMPSVYLGLLSASAQGGLAFGSQNCFWEQQGPYTGEVSPAMLKSVGCEYVILGHSERREILGENEEIVNKKLKAVLAVGLTPILCIGEKENEKEQMKGVLESQLAGCLRDIKAGQIPKIIFVYEPVWAISTSGGQFCSPDYAFGAGLLIKRFLIDRYGKYIGNKAKIIYGGSVNAKEKNTVMYIKEAKMDGTLIGAASLKAEEFGKIIKSVNEISN